MRHVARNTRQGNYREAFVRRVKCLVSRAMCSVSREGGYIAIVSALIISAIIVAIVVAVGQASFLGRAGIAGAHYKERSRALAGACANTALLKLASSSSYGGNETINVASDTCRIFTIVSSSTGRIIDAQGIFERSYTNYRVTVASGTVDIIRWEELNIF